MALSLDQSAFIVSCVLGLNYYQKRPSINYVCRRNGGQAPDSFTFYLHAKMVVWIQTACKLAYVNNGRPTKVSQESLGLPEALQVWWLSLNSNSISEQF